MDETNKEGMREKNWIHERRILMGRARLLGGSSVLKAVMAALG